MGFSLWGIRGFPTRYGVFPLGVSGGSPLGMGEPPSVSALLALDDIIVT